MLDEVVPRLDRLLTLMNGGEIQPAGELAATFPFLFLGLAAAAAALTIFRTFDLGPGPANALLGKVAEDDGSTRPPTAGMVAAASATVLCAGVITLYAALYPVHLMVAGMWPRTSGMAQATETVRTFAKWVERQRADGTLEERVRQARDGTGRLTLPAGEEPADGKCSITYAWGMAEPAAVRGVGWLGANQARSVTRYCARVACRSPLVWDVPPTVYLYSSHASRNKHWLGNQFIDIFGKGRAPAPGGYCTADGRLAERFHG